MLRITTSEDDQALTLRLEGRLEGLWVGVLTDCSEQAIPRLQGRRLRVDLHGVMFVDPQGKARPAELYAGGAELLADDLETKEIVAEIRAPRAQAAAPAPLHNGEAQSGLAEQLPQLQHLEVELHEVNRQLTEAARPLERLSELDNEQRQQVADELRAGLARWESVTQRIAIAMGTDGATDRKTYKRQVSRDER